MSIPWRLAVRPSLLVVPLLLLAIELWASLGQFDRTADRALLERLFARRPVIAGRLVGDVQGLTPGRIHSSGLYGPSPTKVQTTRGGVRIERRAIAEPGTASLHALALLRLAQGRLDDAILTLKSVLSLSPADAEAASDLAAAYLTRADTRGHAFDLVLAVGATQHALAVRPDLPQALYNRALALTRLSLNHQAVKAWDIFYQAEPLPEWRAEARKWRSELARPTLDEEWRREKSGVELTTLHADAAALGSLITRFPNQTLRWAEENLIPQWAASRQHGDLARARTQLDTLRRIGIALRTSMNDAIVQDSVATIDLAEAEADGARLAALVAGHAAYGHGLARYRAQELNRALPFLEAAVRQLDTAGSPQARNAELYVNITSVRLEVE